MVTGIDLFRQRFERFADRYVLIGGAACECHFAAAGVDFRATKDLDIVICVESLDAEFVDVLRGFIHDGGYRSQETSTGERRFHRFKKPSAPGYPAMLELFSTIPDVIAGAGGHLTPIRLDDESSGLSAILLDVEWYRWIRQGIQLVDGLSVVGPLHLIALKAGAWNDLRARRDRGEEVDGSDIKKHRNDVFRLLAILDPELAISPPHVIAEAVATFIRDIVADPPSDLRPFSLGAMTLDEARRRMRAAFRLGD